MLHRKRNGYRLDRFDRKRKEAREARERSDYAQKACYTLVIVNRWKVDKPVHEGAVPAYLLDRDITTRAKVLSNTIKRKEKASKWEVPLPKVRPVAEDEIFKVACSGKHKTKQWKRMVTKVPCVGPEFTRKPPKYERFIRPMGLKFTKANVTHPELKCTLNPGIIGIKKNPNGPMYISLGAVTKGTISEGNMLKSQMF